MNSKNKGKGGERELAQILTHLGGWEARRTGFMQSHHAPWYAILPLEDLIEVLQCADLEALKIRMKTRKKTT
jgi:Holliday junction resolvase